VYEAHRWFIAKLSDVLITEAISECGPEIIRHQTLPQVGFQFHTEKFVYSTDGDELFQAWWNKFVIT
jgi:anthranilate/para-aminobenzoate synthase component II